MMVDPLMESVIESVLRHRENKLFQKKVQLELDGGQLLMLHMLIQTFGFYVLPQGEVIKLLEAVKKVNDESFSSRPAARGDEGVSDSSDA